MISKLKALIVGSEGQDGFYLRKYLENLNYDVLGITSNKVVPYNFDGNYTNGSVTDSVFCDYIVSAFMPDEVYYFAAVHQASNETVVNELSFYNSTININAIGYLNLLQAGIKQSKQPKYFFASSSHVFAKSETSIQNENTKLEPNSIYGISKVLGMNFNELYRDKGMFCVSGIFYNHESPLRQEKFVSKKIISQAVDIYLKKRSNLVLGNLDAKIDWGYAPDYVEAAHKTLQQNESGNYIISSGQLNCIKDFVSIAFNELGLKWEDYVEVNQQIIQKLNTTTLQGDNTKLKNNCNWKPSINFEEMVKLLIHKEISTR